MSSVSEVSSDNVEMEQAEQKTDTHIAVLPDNLSENTEGLRVERLDSRSGSSSLYDSDGEDDGTNNDTATLPEDHTLHASPRLPHRSSSKPTPSLGSAIGGSEPSNASGFPEMLGSRKGVIEQQTSATEPDKTIGKDETKSGRM